MISVNIKIGEREKKNIVDDNPPRKTNVSRILGLVVLKGFLFLFSEEFFKNNSIRNEITYSFKFFIFIFIWLLINICKVLSDCFLTYKE
jgi:hypothetical protein